MSTSVSHTTGTIPLDTSRIPRSYTALIKTSEKKNDQKREATIVWKFKLACFGAHPQGGLGYKVQTQKRLLLDSKDRPIQKLNKAQTIALKTASINNSLVLRVSPHFGLVEIVNTQQIRHKWEKVRAWLLETYPDSKGIVTDFDWQLQNERIQGRYLTDPFYNFFFGNFFDRSLPFSYQGILANILGTIDLPVKRTINISKEKPQSVRFKSEMDNQNTDFPVEKMNAFLGELLGRSGREHSLSFQSMGNYELHSETGFINAGNFTCKTDIDDIYSKMISVILSREDNG